MEGWYRGDLLKIATVIKRYIAIIYNNRKIVAGTREIIEEWSPSQRARSPGRFRRRNKLTVDLQRSD
jgi:hypothetical protein